MYKVGIKKIINTYQDRFLILTFRIQFYLQRKHQNQKRPDPDSVAFISLLEHDLSSVQEYIPTCPSIPKNCILKLYTEMALSSCLSRAVSLSELTWTCLQGLFNRIFFSKLDRNCNGLRKIVSLCSFTDIYV